jgi:GNAT superfamily N-acetyltransferase
MDKVESSNLQIRFADRKDIPLILELIRELAEYEHLLDKVVATEDILREWLFDKEKAEVLIGELNGMPIAYALFFHNFSTFLGRSGIYLEDIYVRPEMRGNGIGKKMLKYLARLTVDRGCGRLEWSCLIGILIAFHFTCRWVRKP